MNTEKTVANDPEEMGEDWEVQGGGCLRSCINPGTARPEHTGISGDGNLRLPIMIQISFSLSSRGPTDLL